MVANFNKLPGNLRKLALKLGYVPLVADRDTLTEAYDYADSVAKSCGDANTHVLTAIHVVWNTWARSVAELGEHVQVALDYMKQRSLDLERNDDLQAAVDAFEKLLAIPEGKEEKEKNTE